MDSSTIYPFDNFLRSRLKSRIEFLEKYTQTFPVLLEEGKMASLKNQSANLKDLDLNTLYLLEIEIVETESSIEKLLKGEEDLSNF